MVSLYMYIYVSYLVYLSDPNAGVIGVDISSLDVGSASLPNRNLCAV